MARSSPPTAGQSPADLPGAALPGRPALQPEFYSEGIPFILSRCADSTILLYRVNGESDSDETVSETIHCEPGISGQDWDWLRQQVGQLGQGCEAVAAARDKVMAMPSWSFRMIV